MLNVFQKEINNIVQSGAKNFLHVILIFFKKKFLLPSWVRAFARTNSERIVSSSRSVAAEVLLLVVVVAGVEAAAAAAATFRPFFNDLINLFLSKTVF